MKGVRPVKIPELLRDDRITFSLEIFPPKKAINKNKLYNIVRELKPLEPDYISVTHGAGGKEKDAFTCEIASTIKKWYDIETMAHLTCVNAGREQIELAIDDLKESGIKNVLALRGDIDPEKGNTGDYEHANELVSIIKEKGGLNILGACYPEGHYESPDLETDIEHLKYKIDAGVEGLITQLFFDNELMYRYLDKLDKAGITVPVAAGIMPITNANQIKRTVSLSGASLPPEFTKMIGLYEHDSKGLFEAGIDYAVDQIRRLIDHGIDGIHLYIMNSPEVAKRVYEGIKDLL